MANYLMVRIQSGFIIITNFEIEFSSLLIAVSDT